MRLYTDGATSKNGYDGAIGGYAWAIVDEDDNCIAYANDAVIPATNNICELIALIEGCRNCAERIFDDPILVYSDSAYCIRCYQEKWYKKWQANGWVNSKNKPVANKELWEQLIPYFEDPRFDFCKVSGHSGDRWNEYVDKLAVAARLLS